jgi:SAM-dependent methyltransferase
MGDDTSGNASSRLPSLYRELAGWFHLLTAPEDYAEEAAIYHQAITEGCLVPPVTLLELGSGGGNNAFHLKRSFTMTLSDLSPEMLVISRQLNPECEHVQGDMREIRLGRQFDAVFIHDAISYLTTADDLRRAIETAFVHCRPGGAALFCPDCVRETYSESTKHGGHDGEGKGLRYLSWTWDPDPTDTSYTVQMAYLLREGNDVRCVGDRHMLGLFAEEEWLTWIRSAGFSARSIDHKWSGEESAEGTRIFRGTRPR